MKNRIFIILVCVFVWMGCDEREIPEYNTGKYYIEFENETIDSTIFTFIYYPNNEYYDLPIPVKIAGEAADKDLTYKVSVDGELSTVESKHYTLPETMVFRKGLYHDTCYVRLNKTADLSNGAVRLVARPAWWDSNVEQYYLGTYSQKKFVLFLRVTGADLTDASDSEKRAYALDFKQYLIDHRGEPETIDEDGQRMTVPVLGLE